MEALNKEIVRESAIFAALSPRGYSRRDENSDARRAVAAVAGPSTTLPPVYPRDANAILPAQSLQKSRFLQKTPQALMMAVPMTTNERWLVWKFLCDWVKTQLAMEVPASIPGFGTFYLRVQSLGIRITFFEPDKQFLRKFCLQVDSEMPDPALATLSSTGSNSDALASTESISRAPSVVGLGDVFVFSFVEMAACCGNAVDSKRAQEWLHAVINKLGNAMSQCDRVELNIGVGVIVCGDCVIQRHLLSRDSRPPPRLDYEIRTGESVVKRKLLAQAALQTTPTPPTKYSFLSGSTFSSSIQLNPVLDRSKDVPDFSFGPPNPRRPTFHSVVATSDSKASPRPTQLHHQYHRSPSPRISRINASVTTESAPTDDRNEAETTYTLTKQEGEETSTTPQLFDWLSRTLFVEPDQNVSYLLPSNRIGSNFMPAAALLMTEKSASQYGQLTHHSGGVVFIEQPSFSGRSFRRQRKELLQNATPEQRYFEYLADDKFFDRSNLAPLPADLESRVVAAAVKYITGPSSDRLETVLEVAHQEFVDNYYTSAKKAILNYMLMRAESCERLEIPQGAPAHALLPIKWKWGSSDGPNGCIADLKTLVRRRSRSQLMNRVRITDRVARSELSYGKAARRKRAQSKLMSLLIFSNPQVRALRYMWHEMFASITLVDLPSGEDLNGMEPMDIIQFERTQLAFSAKAKAFVMENWYMKAKMMFESAIQAETFSIHTSEAAVSFRLRHLFDTVSAVMSLQIRSLIMKSVQAYVNFFERFGVVNESQDSDDNVHYEARPTRPGLLMTLVLLGDQIQFRDPLVDIPSRLLNVLHNIPKLFTNLGRIETQFEEPILLSATSSPFLWNVVAQEDDIVVATIRIRAIIEQNLSYLRKLQTDYDMFALTHRYVNSVDCFHLEENSELETYRAEMERVQTTALRLAIDNRHSQHLGLFSVDCRHVNTRLHTDLARWTIRLLQAFEQRTGRMNAELRQQYKEIAARLAKTPLDLYELVDGEAFVKSLKSEKLQKLQEKGNVIKQRLRFLLFERENTHIGNVTADPSLESIDSEHKDFRLSLDLLSSTAKTLNWRSHIDKLLVEAESQLVNERSRIESMFIAKRSRFQAEIEEFEGEVRGFAKKGDLRHAATYVVQLAKMQDNIVNFRQAMTTIIQEEQKLQWKPTDFGKLDDIAEEMAPYERLWKTVREFREMNSKWLRGNVFELPGNEGMQTLQQMLTVVSDVSSVLILNSAAAAITAEAVRKQMTDFRENVRFLVAIQNPAMKERHMKAVSGLIGIDFTSEEAITLLKLLENGVFERIGDIVDISCNATQEQQIERALHEIRDEWEAISFNLVPSRHPITVSTALAPILSTDNGEPETVNIVLEKDCGEQIVSLMEDHLLRLQSLSCMAHAGPFIEEIAFWQTFASEMGQIVEMLVLVEHRWRRITPLFAAGIVENDSKSSRLFVSAAKLYQSSHATILRNPACAEYCQQSNTTVDLDQTPKSPATSLISDLEECHEILETVRADVRVGFESKQASFSRFYYLSDLELVTALALAEVPSDVSLWKALSRCFPGIHSVQTNPANEITALLSSVGEPFPLGSAITTKDTSMPTWLTKLETSMTTILHASIRAACSDLPRKEFRKWCLVWPEQSLLVAIQHTWTLESEQAYQNANQRKAWTEITEKILQNTDAVWKEMRVTAYPHAKVALANTILLLTQLRDVSASALADVGGMWVEESDEKKSERHTFPHFSPSLCWAAQPRFYFIDSVLSVTMMTSSYLPYGLEYLGNGSSGILVTPLTLRCYHAVAQAVSTMTKGVCLEGTAGTGKSTICHQLARLCGRLYVTFQCANKKLVFNELVNYVKATASSGAWLCIDNFQLLNAVNVSLITMLCAQVMNGLAARHAQCTLVGDRVRLRRGALFFLTLTTGHGASGNEQLVQEARFFFRTIVVQSPDIEKLAEFEFQNARFVHASELAKLLTVALRSFERGFEMMNHPSATTNETNILGSRLANLRVVKNVVIRAAELNDAEKEHRRRTRRSLLISDEEHEEVSATQEPIPNDTTAEAIAKRDEEVVEHQCVFLAIQECIGSVVPAAYLHLINAVLRDFHSDFLSNNQYPWNHETQETTRLDGARRCLERDVGNYIRTDEFWKHFGVEFGMKTIQLLQVMKTSRAVVLSGASQVGKTSLYASLSRALSEISKTIGVDRISARKMSVGKAIEPTLVAPTRCVVVCPRALQLDQLLSVEAEDQSRSVLFKLLQEAKTLHRTDKRTQTWLVFDGDLDPLWSEQLLYTVEELQDDIPGYRKGLRLSSGKVLVVPHYVHVVMETTTLTNASPSFLSRIGVVHVGGCEVSQKGEHVYAVWKILRKAEFEKYGGLIFGILDTLVSELVPVTLEFVDVNFQNYTNFGQGMEQVQWMLAFFHSSLNQSWKKFCSLTSEKQRNTAVHCLFLQALVWGVGSTTDVEERRKFHVFLYDFILHGPNNEQSTLKRLVLLFFPTGILVGSVSSNVDGSKSNTVSKLGNGGAISPKQTMYDYGFSLEFGSKWLLWPEYYTRWSETLLGAAFRGPSTLGESGSVTGCNYSFSSRLNRLVVPTGTSSSAICLSGQLLLANYPALLIGPKDCGKTACGSAWSLLSTSEKLGSSVSVLSESEQGKMGATSSNQAMICASTSVEKIYSGYYTGASDVLFHLETALQRIRIERQGCKKRDTASYLEGPDTASIPNSKNTVFVFVDDLQCVDPNRRMDSSLELFRMLAEYQTVVDPVTSLVTKCKHVVPFATLQLPTPSVERSHTRSDDIGRLLHRFIPIGLLPFSDSDLTSICESISHSNTTLSQPPGTPFTSSGKGTHTATVKDSENLLSIVVKASLKLYRLLTSSNDVSIFSKKATFNPVKLHYNFRVAQLFRLVTTICCEIRPSLSPAEKPALSRLWCHESARVFGDSIIDSKESLSYHQHTIDVALATFGVATEAFFPASFATQDLQDQSIAQNWFANDLHFSYMGDSPTGVYRHGYHEVTDIPKLELLVERSMMAMTSSTSSSPVSMEITMCTYVIKHILHLSRLLRMGTKAVLLLGASGRKLVTITRLACFICKRVSAIYRIPGDLGRPNEEMTDRSKWNATFRTAMLKSIRARDTSLVFIVKDVYLHPDAYPYRIIDKFLGGHNLPPDVIAYEHLDEEILAVLREREQSPAQVTRSNSRKSVTTLHQTPPMHRSKSALLDYFFQCVRQKLQLVLVLSPTEPKNWTSILWRFPNILKCCDVNYAGPWSTDDLVTMARKSLKQSTVATDALSVMKYSEAAVQVYEATCRFLEDQRTHVTTKTLVNHKSDSEESLNTTPLWDSTISPFVSLKPSMLMDHLSLFTAHYDQVHGTVSSNMARFKAGLEFIDQTAQILKTEQTQADLLLPEMLEKPELRRRMSGSWERERIATEKVTRALELATTLAVAQRERLAMVTHEYDNLIKDSRDAFDQIKSSLQKFHEACEDEDVDGENIATDGIEVGKGNTGSVNEVDTEMVARRRLHRQIREFASLNRIPSSIYQLSECIGVILGIEPVEGRDEMDPDETIMNYWANVAMQVNSTAFWKTLSTFDVRDVTEKMLSVLLPICRSPDFDKDLFATVHEVAGVLCEWVQKCTAFARDFVLALPKQAQLEREKELLKEAEKQVVKTKVEIYNQSTSAQQAGAQRDLSEQERQRADEKLHDSTSLLQLTSAAWKVLFSTREKWQQRYDAYTELAEHWKGDLLLATAVVSYASCLNYSVRLQLHRLWTEAVAPYSLTPSSLHRPLHEIFRIGESELAKMNLNGVQVDDESTLESAVIALNCYRSPLLIDPYGVAFDWLKKQLGAGKVAVASGNNTTTNAGVWKEVATSIKQQTSLIIMDICEDRLQGLHSFVESKRRAMFDAVNRGITVSRNGSGYCCWCYPPEDPTEETDAVETPAFEFRSDACRVFFVYTDSNVIPEWMSKYLSQLTVIQFELTASFVESQALHKVLESQGRLREVTEIRTLQQEMVIYDEQIYGLEEELLEFFNTEKTEVVYSDNSKALRIIANRRAANTLQSTKTEAMATIQTHWDSLKSYAAVARRCLDGVWAWREFNFLDNRDFACTEKLLPLSRVWQLLVRAGELSNKNDTNLEEVMACFTGCLQQYVSMNLRDEECLLFRFLLAFRIWQRRMDDRLLGPDVVAVPSEITFRTRLSTNVELLVRLLSLVGPQSDRDACRPTMKSLLALRPTGVKAKAWSVVCYLAEASGTLRQFISTMQSMESGQTAWQLLFEQDTMMSSEWNTPVPLDVFMRLCIVVAVHPQRFLGELEDFAERELKRIHLAPVTATFCSLTVTETSAPSLPTLVAAAAHSAPDRLRDLYYMWQSFSSARTPIVVPCPPTIDFVGAVANVARRAGATIDTGDTIQLLLSDEADFKKLVLLAMEKGQWIVLPNLHSSHGRLEQLNSIYELLGDKNVHSDFRLWISIRNKPACTRHFESMLISQRAIRREWGRGCISLKRSLQHTFNILKQELDGLMLNSTVGTLTSASVLGEKEERCIKQFGVFHAFVSCRDHFPFAQWKIHREFGDTELCTVLRSMVALDTEKEMLVKELHSTPWNEVTLRGVITNVYASTLKSDHDKQLIECCITFMLNAWPTLQGDGKRDTTMTAVHLTVPEAVLVIEKLAVIPWMSVVSAIPYFWKSELRSPPMLKDSAAMSEITKDVTTLWDPHNLRSDRHKEMATKLAVMVTNRGYQVNSTLMPAQPHPSDTLSLLESLTEFCTSIDSVTLPVASDSENEHKKPISALINHERRALTEIRSAIQKDIKRLERVGVRDQALDADTWQLFEVLRRNCVPKSWLSLLRLPISNGNISEGQDLNNFQSLFLRRLHGFSSWKDSEDGPYRLPLDNFLETKVCVVWY
ncbi:Dynein heavy chain region D6 P-loop domain [Phytophthora infestans]|uniref:Dynein heavy chain region D6 P-loop domain n=1 Tax=Phytophthora infestans TaxID=4787 RepID=A0A8S9TZ84_PHYIN|nr:Dynein heavy chain region D6 P-loop domain [Phytophthora infestans]